MNNRQEHPGKTFKAILKEYGITQLDAALMLKMTPSRVGEFCRGEKRINTKLAIRLSYILPKTTPQEWLALQSKYDISCITPEEKEIIRRDVIPIVPLKF